VRAISPSKVPDGTNTCARLSRAMVEQIEASMRRLHHAGLGILRDVLSRMLAGCAITSRSLEPMAPKPGAVFVSIAPWTARSPPLEPRAAAPYRGRKTVRRLSERGVPCGTLVAPIIPFLNDKEWKRFSRP